MRCGAFLSAAFAFAFIVSGGDAAHALSCSEAVGISQAAIYVRQCTQVSAGRPIRCVADNACYFIIAEIRRGCGLAGDRAPGFCAAYRDQSAQADRR